MITTESCKDIVSGLVAKICSDLLIVEENLSDDWENLETEIARMASRTALISYQFAAYAGVVSQK